MKTLAEVEAIIANQNSDGAYQALVQEVGKNEAIKYWLVPGRYAANPNKEGEVYFVMAVHTGWMKPNSQPNRFRCEGGARVMDGPQFNTGAGNATQATDGTWEYNSD